MSGKLYTKDIALTALVSVLAALQLGLVAKAVGNQRRKHKINPPATDGPPEFVRAFRAQQNCLEFFGMFMTTFWMASIFFHQVPACIAAGFYMLCRHNYYHQYVESAKGREGPFKKSLQALYALMVMSFVGIGNSLLDLMFDLDIKEKLLGD